MALLSLEQWQLSNSTTAAILLLTTYLTLYWLQTVKKHKNEPPILPSNLPFLGPLIGMLLHGGRHMKTIGLRNLDKPIFTIPVPFSRLYIITDPSLAGQAQRATKTLSFTPLVPESLRRVMGIDKRSAAIAAQNQDPEPGQPHGILSEVNELVVAYFAPGEDLNAISLRTCGEFCKLINDFAASLQDQGGVSGTLDLQLWIRHLATIAPVFALYGPRNPIAVDPTLEQAFWDFDHGLGMLLLNIFPSVTCPKAYRGRERFQAALLDYLNAGHINDAADIIKRRFKILKSHNWSLDMFGREMLSFYFANVVNTATAGFWLVLQLFANPQLLAEVRREIAAAVTTAQPENSAASAELRIDLETLKTSSPILTSAFREVLRLNSDNSVSRLVKSDTLLAGRYFLAKDCVVQIAGGVIHADERVWGADAAVFNPYRFLKLSAKTAPADSGTAFDVGATSDTKANGGKSGDENATSHLSTKVKGPEKQVHPAAFRAFGGGKTLCPGRHFATNEILALAAMTISMFEIESADGRPLKVPLKNDEVLPIHILEPRAEDVVNVRIRLRDSRQPRRVTVV
jgi:cytochrome P450